MASVADCLRAAAFSPHTLTPQAGAILWSILIPETLLRAIAAYLVRCTILSLTALHIPLARGPLPTNTPSPASAYMRTFRSL